MWIPYRLYEALPKIYIGVGGLVLASALYFGFDSRSLFAYLFVALGCFAYGASIMWQRYRYRRPRPVSAAERDSTVISLARKIH